MLPQQTVQTMTSLEIAETTEKNHKDVLRAIRNMEPAWEKVCGRKFALSSTEVQMPNGGVRKQPYYTLTKTECLYIASKFDDEVRAKLVKRWESLEEQNLARQADPLEALYYSMGELIEQKKRTAALENRFNAWEEERKENIRQLELIELSPNAVPEKTTRAKCNEAVRMYAIKQNVPYSEVWKHVYKDVYYRFGIQLSGDNKLDEAERRGVIDKVWDVVSDIVKQ